MQTGIIGKTKKKDFAKTVLKNEKTRQFESQNKKEPFLQQINEFKEKNEDLKKQNKLKINQAINLAGKIRVTPEKNVPFQSANFSVEKTKKIPGKLLEKTTDNKNINLKIMKVVKNSQKSCLNEHLPYRRSIEKPLNHEGYIFKKSEATIKTQTLEVPNNWLNFQANQKKSKEKKTFISEELNSKIYAHKTNLLSRKTIKSPNLKNQNEQSSELKKPIFAKKGKINETILNVEEKQEQISNKPKRPQKLLNRVNLNPSDKLDLEETENTYKKKRERSTSKTSKVKCNNSLNHKDVILFADDKKKTFVDRNFGKKLSIESSNTLVSEIKKHKIKPRPKNTNQKTKILNSKNKNSLKDLLSQYKILKNTDEKKLNLIDSLNLEKMKQKLGIIQTVLDQKLKNIGFDNSVLQNSAIKIQKFWRGFLARKSQDFPVFGFVHKKDGDKLKGFAEVNFDILSQKKNLESLKINQEKLRNTNEDFRTFSIDRQKREIYTPPLNFKTIVQEKSKRSQREKKAESVFMIENLNEQSLISEDKLNEVIEAEKTVKEIEKESKSKPKNSKIFQKVESKIDKKIKDEFNSQKSDFVKIEAKKDMISDSKFYNEEKPKTQMSSILNFEFKNWQKLSYVLDELNSVLNHKNETDCKFTTIVNKMTNMANNNLLQIKSTIEKTNISILKIPSSNLFQNPLSFALKTPKNVSIPKIEEHFSLKSNFSKKSFDEIWPGIKQLKKSASNLNITRSQIYDKLNASDCHLFVTERQYLEAQKSGQKYEQPKMESHKKEDLELLNIPLSILNQKCTNYVFENSLAGKKSKIIFPDQFYSKKTLSESVQKSSVDSISVQNSVKEELSNNGGSVVLKTGTRNLSHDPTSIQFEDLEYEEIPIPQIYDSLGFLEITSEHVFDYLLGDVLLADLWSIPVKIQNCVSDNFDEPEDNIYGIRTNISAVNEYCSLLIKFLEDKIDILFENFEYKNLSINAQDKILEFFDENQKKCWEKKTNHVFLLKETEFLTLEDQILENYKCMNINEQLFEMQRIFHRCIFDSFNEILTKTYLEKNFEAIKKKNKRENKKLNWKKEHKMQFIYLAKNKLLDNTLTLCGLIKDKEDSMMGKSVQNFGEDAICVIREERLFKMVRNEFLKIMKEDSNGKSILGLWEIAKSELSKEIEELLMKDCSDFLEGKTG